VSSRAVKEGQRSQIPPTSVFRFQLTPDGYTHTYGLLGRTMSLSCSRVRGLHCSRYLRSQLRRFSIESRSNRIAMNPSSETSTRYSTYYTWKIARSRFPTSKLSEGLHVVVPLLIIFSSNVRKDIVGYLLYKRNCWSPCARRAYLAFQRKGLKVCTKRAKIVGSPPKD